MMHTRAERKMLPSRQPARGAAARPASLENGRDHSCLADGEFIVNKRQRAARGHIREAAFFGILTKIEDEGLDEMILEARASTDQEYRKAMYKACLDTIIDWACEIPVYQRQNAIIFSTERVNIDTITPDITTFYGWLNEIQNIEMR